ncbi:MAG: acyl-CoA dehydrogenase family protein [Gemmatimonadetes bacterium]|nr:acyl-CoA dehydrogenase family protein [Gemmatimonadota bacterium]
MDPRSTPEIEALRETARAIVDETLIPAEPGILRTGTVPEEGMRRLKEAGMYGITIPKEYGGMGLHTFAQVLVHEELSRAHHGFLGGLTLSNGIGVSALLTAGSDELRRRYVPAVASGEVTTAFALTEPEAGSDAARIRTRAVRHGDEWVIDGVKHYITNGPSAELVTVIAVTDPEKGTRGGVTAFLVDRREMEGVVVDEVQRTMGTPPYSQARLRFEGVRVPASHVLGREGDGFRLAMGALDHGRIAVAAGTLGPMARLISAMVDRAKGREQFGGPISQFQGVQWMIADSETDRYAARQVTYDAAWRMDQGERVTREASMAKLFATEAVGRVADRAVQLFGGQGVMESGPVQHLYRDVRVMRIYEGTSEIQRLVIAREALKG